MYLGLLEHSPQLAHLAQLTLESMQPEVIPSFNLPKRGPIMRLVTLCTRTAETRPIHPETGSKVWAPTTAFYTGQLELSNFKRFRCFGSPGSNMHCTTVQKNSKIKTKVLCIHNSLCINSLIFGIHTRSIHDILIG